MGPCRFQLCCNSKAWLPQPGWHQAAVMRRQWPSTYPLATSCGLYNADGRPCLQQVLDDLLSVPWHMLHSMQDVCGDPPVSITGVQPLLPVAAGPPMHGHAAAAFLWSPVTPRSPIYPQSPVYAAAAALWLHLAPLAAAAKSCDAANDAVNIMMHEVSSHCSVLD